jgi:hypothetical protein
MKRTSVIVAFLVLSFPSALAAQAQTFIIHGSAKLCNDITQLDRALSSHYEPFFAGWTLADYDAAIAWASQCSQYGWQNTAPSRIPILQSLSTPLRPVVQAPPPVEEPRAGELKVIHHAKAIVVKTAEPEPPKSGFTQEKFCTLLSEFRQKYQSAGNTKANQAALSEIRHDRMESLTSFVGEHDATRWRGILKNIRTRTNGTATISVRLACQIEIDIELTSQDLPRGTALYAVLMKLPEGSKITFDGSFAHDSPIDYLRETSVTEFGSMGAPEFEFFVRDFTGT